MIVNTGLARSKGCDEKDRWETPTRIFEKLDREFNFTLDPCCELHTAKCDMFFTEEIDGLSKSWIGENVFVNPPYSRGNIDKWVAKCLSESLSLSTVVALLPVSSSADWWHKYIVGKCEMRFVNKRIRFVGAPYPAPFSSVIVIFGRSGIKTFNQ